MTKARSNATANAAKGDLTVGNGTNLSGVLGVGSNGDTIVADSSTSTGLRYTAGTVQSNPVLNSSFQVWQRGTSFTYAGGGIAYQADRWQGWGTGPGSAYTVSRQATGDTTNLPNIQYCLRMQRTAGNTNTDFWAVIQSMESVNSIPFAGKTVTLSFYARRGANFSGASNGLTALLYSGTGTDQNLSSGFTGSAVPINNTATLTTTWQRFSYTGTISSTATQLGLNFSYQGSGTAGAADFFEITGVQIDVGSVALPFRTYAGTIQGETSACQRYFYRMGGNSVNDQPFGSGVMANTTSAIHFVQFPVTMRTAPSGAFSAAGTFYLYGGGGAAVPSAVSLGATTNQVSTISATRSATTANLPSFIIALGTANAFIDFSAEL